MPSSRRNSSQSTVVSVKESFDTSLPSNYRNPRSKLFHTIFHLLWASAAVFTLLRHNLRHTAHAGDLVCTGTVSSMVPILRWVYFAVYLCFVVFQIIRIIAILRLRFLDSRPDHRLGLPKEVHALLLLMLMATTIWGSMILWDLRRSCEVPSHGRWHPCQTSIGFIVMYSWISLFVAFVSVIRRRFLCIDSSRAWRKTLMTLLHSRLGGASTNDVTYQRAVEFVEDMFQTDSEVCAGNAWDLMILLRAFHERMERENAIAASANLAELSKTIVSKDVLYFAKFAQSAYGVLMSLYMDPVANYSSAVCCIPMDQRHRQAFSSLKDIDEDNILLASTKAETRNPMFYAVADHEKQALVIAISGTIRLADVCTDMETVAETLECIGMPNSYAHSGMLNAAFTVESALAASPAVMGFLEEHPSYAIYPTGHSLGGGVSSLLVRILSMM